MGTDLPGEKAWKFGGRLGACVQATGGPTIQPDSMILGTNCVLLSSMLLMRECVGVKGSWLRMQLLEGTNCEFSCCGQQQQGARLPQLFESDMWIGNNRIIGMDWQGLQLLLKAPKKKYVKKLIEFAIAVCGAPSAVPADLTTPIYQEFTTDLELSVEESHQLITALISFLSFARGLQFQESALRNAMISHLPEELTGILTEIVCKLSEDIGVRDSQAVSQAERLMGFQWALEMEVASDKGKANVPVVRLDIKTAKQSSLRSSVLEMKGTEFEVFFKNLQKMKEQLGQLVSSSD